MKNLGVVHAGIFGSVARGSQNADSDIDILIELNPGRPIDVFAYAGLKRYITELFPVPVDVVNKQSLKKHISPLAEEDTIYAF